MAHHPFFIFLLLAFHFNSIGQPDTTLMPPTLRFTSNPGLKTIKEQWLGTPIDPNNRFVNYEHAFTPNFKDVLKWQFSEKPQKDEKKKDTFRVAHFNDTTFLHSSSDCIVWLGHATFFIRLNGINLLIDPVFFNVPFVKRYANHAFGPFVFENLDYLLISHDHQDHCQKKSIAALSLKNPHMKVLTGLNMTRLLAPWLNGQQIETAGWYQQYQTKSINIYFLPARHWSKRSLNDDNARLWGGFVIEAAGKSVYFSGDTGYGGHFSEAKSLFPSLDIAIIGVGAYKPEWFMAPNHISPTDAVKAFEELGAKILIPMHYGTFDLSDEPVGEPLRVLRQLQADQKISGELKALGIGEALFW